MTIYRAGETEVGHIIANVCSLVELQLAVAPSGLGQLNNSTASYILLANMRAVKCAPILQHRTEKRERATLFQTQD